MIGALGALRAEVAEANAAIDRAGLVTLSFGNVSGVDREAGVLVIKPSGAPYTTLRPEDLVVVSLDDGRVVEGDKRPSVDTSTHRALYETSRPDQTHHTSAGNVVTRPCRTSCAARSIDTPFSR